MVRKQIAHSTTLFQMFVSKIGKFDPTFIEAIQRQINGSTSSVRLTTLKRRELKIEKKKKTEQRRNQLSTFLKPCVDLIPGHELN